MASRFDERHDRTVHVDSKVVLGSLGKSKPGNTRGNDNKYNAMNPCSLLLHDYLQRFFGFNLLIGSRKLSMDRTHRLTPKGKFRHRHLHVVISPSRLV